jgi:tetratricopeptide (TPR) repeat protein
MTQASSLSPDDWERLAELFEQASALPPAAREALLQSEAVDERLRAELASLLSHATESDAFFGQLQHVVADSAQAVIETTLSDRLPAAAAITDPRVGATLRHYRIEERLGQGGMGVVYRATDQRLHRTVALKLLRTESPDDPRAKERLLAEARATASLDHVNICTVFEVGETDDQLPFIAMAFYPGETLEQVLRRGPLPVAVAVDYAMQIARGLAAAHQRGIVHRDVKPANVIVTADGVLKLLDFGIARHLGLGASQEGVTPGTIAYMSPEQVTSRTVDQRSDLWALGIVLYEMCTGERPFAGDHAGAILYAIVHEVPPPAVTFRSDLPAQVSAIIDRLLTKDPAQRYADADELVADLLADDAPVIAAAPRSRRVLWYLLAALLLVGFVAWWSRPTISAPTEARIAAQDLYEQGHRDVLFRTESGRREALDFFRQAIATDSTYVDAHAGLAHLLVLISDNAGGSRRAQLMEAEAAARTAIRLDSLHADAHASLGHVLLSEYQFAAAETEFQRAIALDPETPYVREFLVWLYIFMERPRDALAAAERGVADNPASPTAIAEQARALLVNGRCTDAWPLLKRLMMLKPPPARVGSIAAQCYAQQKQWANAIDAVRPVAQQSPLQGNPWLAFMLAQGGDSVEARVIRDTLVEQWRRGSSGAYGVALAYAGARDFTEAFAWLDKSIDDRSLRYNIMEPAFDELRRDPRFAQVRRKLGIAR